MALAGGLVLPFEGPGGYALSLALADRSGAPSPVLVRLTFPEVPWAGGWNSILTDASGPEGARLAYEASGAAWALVGRVHADGWIEACLYDDGGLHRARFSDAWLLAHWLARRVEAPQRRFEYLPQLDEPLFALANSGAEAAAASLETLDAAARKRLESEIAAVKNLFSHGADLEALGLPKAVLDYWKHRSDPGQMADAGVGPVWKAYLPLMEDDREAAGERARLLLRSERALDVAGALLLLRALEDASWPAAARRLTEVAPEMPLGWEELSFAAFDADDPETARRALERALELDPDNGLYWTNLGWARYLLGDLGGAIAASLRAMELDANPTAAYNLGLFYALARDHDRAFSYYLEAMRRDGEGVAPMALADLAATRRSDLLFWQGFLLERTGRNAEARRAYADFLTAHPDHPLAPLAREALAALEKAQIRLSLLGFRLGPLDVGFEIGSGEPVRPVLRAETGGYLPSGAIAVTVRDAAGTVASMSDELNLPPLTSDWTRVLGPLVVADPGDYQVSASYAGAETTEALRVVPGHLARRLLGQDVVPLGLGGAPLLSPEEMAAADGTERLIGAVLASVRAAAPSAKRIERFARPLAAGPFEGRSVAEVMAAADTELVRRFLEEALAAPEMLLEQDVVNAFATWVAEQH